MLRRRVPRGRPRDNCVNQIVFPLMSASLHFAEAESLRRDVHSMRASVGAVEGVVVAQQALVGSLLDRSSGFVQESVLGLLLTAKADEVEVRRRIAEATAAINVVRGRWCLTLPASRRRRCCAAVPVARCVHARRAACVARRCVTGGGTSALRAA